MPHNNKGEYPRGGSHVDTPPPPLQNTTPPTDQERVYCPIQCVEYGGTKISQKGELSRRQLVSDQGGGG